MALHYPPLANGSYRVGDPPQYMPSRIPGPEATSTLTPGGMYWHGMPPAATSSPGPHHAAPAPAAGGFPPYQAVPETMPVTMHGNMTPVPTPPGRANRTALLVGGLAVVVVLSAALLFAVLRGVATDDGGARAGTFDVTGSLLVESSMIHSDGVECELPSKLREIPDAEISIAADGTNANGGTGRWDGASSRLELTSAAEGRCQFSFGFAGVPGGAEPYHVSLQRYGSLEYSEAEVRSGVEIVITG